MCLTSRMSIKWGNVINFCAASVTCDVMHQNTSSMMLRWEQALKGLMDLHEDHHYGQALQWLYDGCI